LDFTGLRRNPENALAHWPSRQSLNGFVRVRYALRDAQEGISLRLPLAGKPVMAILGLSDVSDKKESHEEHGKLINHSFQLV